MTEGEAEVAKLKEENEALEKKYHNMAKILEMSAKKADEEAAKNADDSHSELEGRIKEVGSGMDELRKSIASIEKKMKKSPDADSSKEIGSIKSSLAAMESRLVSIDKIPDIVNRIEKVEKGSTGLAADDRGGGSSRSDAAGNSRPYTTGLFGGFGTTDPAVYRTGLKDVTNSIEALKSAFEEYKAGSQQRDDEIEKRMATIWAKIDPQTIKALESFSSSREDIIKNIIPMHVHDEIEKILSSFSHEMAAVNDTLKDFSKKAESMNSKALYMLDSMHQLKGRIDEIENKTAKIPQLSESREFEKVREKLSEMEKDIRPELDELKSAVDSKFSAIENLEGRIDDLATRHGVKAVADFEAKLALMDEKVKMLVERPVSRQDDSGLKQRVTALEGTLAAAEKDIRELPRTEMKLTKALDMFNDKAREIDDKTRGMDEDVKKMRKERDEMEKALRSVEKAMDDVRPSLKGLEGRIGELESRRGGKTDVDAKVNFIEEKVKLLLEKSVREAAINSRVEAMEKSLSMAEKGIRELPRPGRLEEIMAKVESIEKRQAAKPDREEKRAMESLAVELKGIESRMAEVEDDAKNRARPDQKTDKFLDMINDRISALERRPSVQGHDTRHGEVLKSIEDFREELKAMGRRMAAAEEEVKDAPLAETRLEKASDAFKARAEKIEGFMEKFGRDRTDLEKIMKTTNQRSEESKEILARMEKVAAANEKKLAVLEPIMVKAQEAANARPWHDELKVLSRENDTLVEKFVQLESRMKAEKPQSQSKETERGLELVRDEISEVGKKVLAMEKSMDSEQLAGEVSALGAKVAQLAGRLAASEKEPPSEIRKNLAVFERRMEKHDSLSEEMKSIVKEADEKLKEVGKFSARLDTMEDMLKGFMKNIDDLSAKVGAATARPGH